jgi:protein-S-isoprenylcysteine O-methyltransferase Ste14
MDQKKKIILIMACAVMFLAFAYLFMVTFVPIPATGSDHSKVIVGFILGTALAGIIAYYWGSSKGSADKSKTIDQVLNSSSPVPTAEVKL